LHFRKPQRRRINFGLTGCEYHYIILKINADVSLADQYLSIDNTSLDTVDIYKIQTGHTPALLYQGGALVKYNTGRNYVWHVVPMEANHTPSWYLIAVKAAQKNINIRYAILHKDALQAQYESYDRFVFFYIGVASMIAAFILIAFVLFRKRFFATYFGYVTCMSVWIVSHYGRLFPFLYPGFPAVNNVVKPVSSLCACACMLLVLKDVFKKQLISKPRLKRSITWSQYGSLLLAIVMLVLLVPNVNSFLKASLITTWHLVLLLSIIVIICTPLRFFKSGTLAKIFSTAMGVICLMTLVQLLANAGLVADYFISEHGMAMGSLVENSIMAFGLFYGLLEERKTRELQVLALEEEQNETLKKLILVQDDERNRIANDLHDNIGPLLAALKINFNRIINSKGNANGLVQKTEAIIDDSIMEIRGIAHNLVPKGISSKGLINALQDYFESLEPLYNKPIRFHHKVQSIFRDDLQVNLYRIICELVLNAVKHSSATEISVKLLANEQSVTVSIVDDGQGFCVSTNKKCLGLQSAESRVQYLKGKFNLRSHPGRGTAIDIEVPLQPDEAQVNRF
jgi:signal transduction histidine kinase